jgi:hypothetical protein
MITSCLRKVKHTNLPEQKKKHPSLLEKLCKWADKSHVIMKTKKKEKLEK